MYQEGWEGDQQYEGWQEAPHGGWEEAEKDASGSNPAAPLKGKQTRGPRPTRAPPTIVIIRVAAFGAALTALVALFAPWYMMPQDFRLGPTFLHPRFYGLLYTTDQTMGVTPWFSLQLEMCRMSSEVSLSVGKATTMIRSEATRKSAEKRYKAENASKERGWGSDLLSTIGDTLKDCKIWPACRLVANARCITYRVLTMALLASWFLIAIGIALLVFVALTIGREMDSANKLNAEEKQKLATRGLIFTSSACGILWVGYLVAFYIFGSSLKSLRKDSIYPMPNLFFGGFIAIISCSLATIAVACTFSRHQNGGTRVIQWQTREVRSSKQRKAGEGEEEYEETEDYGDAYYDENDWNAWPQAGWSNFWGGME